MAGNRDFNEDILPEDVALEVFHRTSTPLNFSKLAMTCRFFYSQSQKPEAWPFALDKEIYLFLNDVSKATKTLKDFTQEDIALFKNSNEPYDAWFARLATANMHSYLLIRVLNKNLIKPEHLSGAKCFSTKEAVERFIMRDETNGVAVFVELNIPSPFVKKLLASNDNFNQLEKSTKPLAFSESELPTRSTKLALSAPVKKTGERRRKKEIDVIIVAPVSSLVDEKQEASAQPSATVSNVDQLVAKLAKHVVKIDDVEVRYNPAQGKFEPTAPQPSPDSIGLK